MDQSRDFKNLKRSQKNSGAEKHNNCNEKFTRCIIPRQIEQAEEKTNKH